MKVCRDSGVKTCNIPGGDNVRDEYGVTIMPFAVSCLTSRWVHIGWIRDDATVWQIIRAVWPFAQGKWIVKVMCGKQVASLSDRPESLPFRIVKICPATVLVGVRVPVVDQKRVFEASILTTVGHIIMEMALLLNVPKESLIMTSHGVILDSGSFVLGIDNLENLEIRWKPLVSIPQFPMITDESSNPAEIDPANVQSENDFIRFAVTHPVWGSIRTVPVSRSSTIHDAIKLLLPDWPIQSRFPVAVDGKFVDSTVLVEWVMHGKKLVIEGCGNKPSPPIEVEIVHGSLASDDVCGHGSKACATFSRYVRSPFKIQAEWMKFQGDTTLLTIGAGFMTKCKSMQSIAVTINGRGVDPRLRAKDINDATIIAFRIMPLVGGAKDDIQSVLSKTLTSRGVSSDCVEARIKQILTDIPGDQIRPHLKEPDFQFWVSLKKLANEHKVRLITNSELKEHQKSQRSDKGKAHDSKPTKGGGKGKRDKGEAPSIDLSRVSLDLSYIEAVVT